MGAPALNHRSVRPGKVNVRKNPQEFAGALVDAREDEKNAQLHTQLGIGIGGGGGN